jgi:excinuclease ABC subunit C
MDRCLGPCTREVPIQDYREIVAQVRLFLQGRNNQLITRLKKKMAEMAAAQEFEKAAGIRDQIIAIERTVERQNAVSSHMEDQDVIALAQKENAVQMVILFVRKGYLLGNRSFLFKDPPGSTSDVMEAFLKQYYVREGFIPREVLISEAIRGLPSLELWLRHLSGKKVLIRKPQRGEKRKLVEMAMENAEKLLEGHFESRKEDLIVTAQSVLKLKNPPRHIEGLDISNLHGDLAVGSIVSFVDGLPHKSGYRSYRIRETDGIDDYGMISELTKRRLSRRPLPDLFLVDGGKGHLTAVKRVLDRYKEGLPPEVISIAKAEDTQRERSDKIYVPGRKNPIALKADHPVLLLMMRIRDEAHRRAIGHHKILRKKGLTESILDHIPGIGPKRKRLLLKHFKDMKTLSRASAEELAQIQGISRAMAEGISAFFEVEL